MKHCFLFLFFIINLISTYGQNPKNQVNTNSFPVEVLVGNTATILKSLYVKPILNSPFKLFNLATYQANYNNSLVDNYLIQTIIFYDIFNNISVGLGGNMISGTSFKPLVSVSYSKFTKNSGFVFKPAYEIHKDGLLEIFSLYKWTPSNSKKINPYFKVSALTSFKSEHAYSFVNLRIGAKHKSFILGPAINANFFGKDFSSDYIIGGFFTFLVY